MNNKGEVIGVTLGAWLAIAIITGVGAYLTETGHELGSKPKPASDPYWAQHSIYRPYTK